MTRFGPATYILIPGAGCTPWHWHPLTTELRRRGHTVIPVDLPCDNDSAGLSAYVHAVLTAYVAASCPHDELVVAAHPLGGMTAPLVCERLPVDLLVLVAGMIPAPGETIQEWWDNTSYEWVDDEGVDTFFHDLPADFAAQARRELRDQSATPMNEPCPLTAWPDVPTRAVIARDDLLFPAAYLRRVTHERLGFTPDEMPGAHFPMLGHPVDLADRLDAYRLAVLDPGPDVQV